MMIPRIAVARGYDGVGYERTVAGDSRNPGWRRYLAVHTNERSKQDPGGDSKEFIEGKGRRERGTPQGEHRVVAEERTVEPAERLTPGIPDAPEHENWGGRFSALFTLGPTRKAIRYFREQEVAAITSAREVSARHVETPFESDYFPSPPLRGKVVRRA